MAAEIVLRTLSTTDQMEYFNSEPFVLTEELIEAIDDFDMFEQMDPAHAINIVGVITGLKPVALEYALENEDEQAALETLLSRMGLCFERVTLPEVEIIVVSREHHFLGKFITALHQSRQDEDIDLYELAQRKIGAYLGYPVTSTDFFLERVRVGRETDAWLDTPIIRGYEEDGRWSAFSQLVLSHEYATEEIAQYSEPLRIAVELLTPQIYSHLINEN